MSYLKGSKKRKGGEDGSDRGAESLEKSLGLRPGNKYSARASCRFQLYKQRPKSNDINYHRDPSSQAHQQRTLAREPRSHGKRAGSLG